MTPALRYTVYLFDGPRAGLTPKPSSYRMCIYDSAQNSDGSTYSPTPPVIKQPKFSIEENSAGSLQFTLLHNATALLHVSTASNPEPHLIDDTPRPITTYIFLKQTEIVLTRSVMYDTKPGQTAPEIKTEEIWAGRISSIKKDFYGNWNIFAEGELSYLNDFTTDAGTFSVNNPTVILTSLINQYNTKVKTFLTSEYTVGNDRAIAFLPIDRTFEVFTVSTGITYTPGVSIKDLATTFEVQSGESFWTAMQNLLDQFGGHFEITKTIRNVTINGTVVQRTRRLISWYANNEYHKYNAITSQAIRFGTNLLDYTEELDATEMFTVIRPLGATNTKTTKNETTGEETSVTTTVDITSVNGGSPYFYTNDVVDKYGCIEKVVTWGDIQQPDALFAVAKAYYNDLHIGEPNITINAYDLKNLLSLSDESPSLPDKESIKQIDSLFLYDKVAIISPYHGYTSSSKQVPITKIEIPLDKFPTDTVYTMSTKAPPRNSLLPGSSIKQLKKETEKNTDEVNKIVDPGHTKPDYTPEYVVPTSGELGIDENTPHWPMIFLNRATPYMTGDFQAANVDDGKGPLITLGVTITCVCCDPDDPSKSKKVSKLIDITQSIPYKKAKINTKTIQGGIVPSSTGALSGFFSDDITNTQAITRGRTASQNISNWYELMRPRTGSDATVLTPFTSGYASQYSIPGPEINASQPWSHLYSGKEPEWNGIYDWKNPTSSDSKLHFFTWNDQPGSNTSIIDFLNTRLPSSAVSALTNNGMSLSVGENTSYVYIALNNPEYSSQGGPEKYYFPLFNYKSVASPSQETYNLCTIGILEYNGAFVVYAKAWSSGSYSAQGSLSYINNKIPHISDDTQKLNNSLLEKGVFNGRGSGHPYYVFREGNVTSGAFEIEGETTNPGVTSTYEYIDGICILYEAPTASSETAVSYLKRYLSVDSSGQPKWSEAQFESTVVPYATSIVESIALSARPYATNYDYDAQYGLLDRQRIDLFTKAEQEAVPVLIITPSKDAGTSSDAYSAIVGAIAYGQSVRIDAAGIASNYSDISAIGQPFMIGQDSYLYLKPGQSYQSVPGLVHYDETRKSPICLMSKCGGLQTKQVANNVYMQLCGASEGMDMSTSTAWQGHNVIVPKPKKEGDNPYLFTHKNPDAAPSSRTLIGVQPVSSGGVTYNREWYDGQDLIDIDKIDLDKDVEMVIPEIRTQYRRFVVVGDSLYLKVGGAVYIKTPPANE